MVRVSILRAAICVLVTLECIPMRAEADIESVTVKTSRNYENVDGYTYSEITIQGTVARADGTVGTYSVPAVLIYPKHGRGNRVGVVDWLNSAFYHFFPPTTEFGTHQFTLNATGNYLFEEGYTYLSIQWNKHVTQIFGPTPPDDGQPHNHLVYGVIDKSADAWEILRDAARFLKDPSAYPGSDRPVPVRKVLSSGYSQGGAAQLEFLVERLDPARVYDGHLIQMIGLVCLKRDDAARDFGFLGDCGPLPTKGNHAPVILLASETDMLIYHPTVLRVGKSAYFTRNAKNPNWRQYEMSGVAHLPEPILSLKLPKPNNENNQNNADARPLFRAAFDNLARWTRGKHADEPPASRYFKGRVDETDAFLPVKDTDGHFAGGVRLPHVQSSVRRRVAGAPLGRHMPINPEGFEPFDPFIVIGGTFTRFKDDELLERYASRHEYVKRVERAADHLAANGYITKRDRKALISAAKNQPLPVPGAPSR